MSLHRTQPLHELVAALPNHLIVTLAGLSKAMMGSLTTFLAPMCLLSSHACVSQHVACLCLRRAFQKESRAKEGLWSCLQHA